jgi:hypothetical protein
MASPLPEPLATAPRWAQEPPPPEAVPSRCLNCGASVAEPYCGQCGQRNADPRISLRQLFGDLFRDVFHLDGKLARTYARLLFRPGSLTRAYLEGQREGYVRPFKVYLAASVALFSYLAVHVPTELIEVSNKGTASSSSAVLRIYQHEGTPGSAADPSPGTIAPQKDLTVHPDDSAFERRLKEGLRKDPDFLRKYLGTSLVTNVPRTMFVLVPAFAALLFLLHFRSRRYYVEHFIFALHTHAFAFAIFLATLVIPWTPVAVMLNLTVPVYLLLALREVYGQPWWKVVIKGALLLGTYVMLIGVAISGVVVAALYMAGA